MSRKFQLVKAPPPAPPTQLRVLSELEKPADHPQAPGVWEADQVIRASELDATSIPILMERGIVMAYIEPAALAALPDSE